jgi:hypothetical protein
MKKKVLLTGICVFLITFVMCITAVTANADEITITGIVVAVDWDDEAKVTAVSIETDDEIYYVSDNPIGKQLLELEGEDVKVTGAVGKDSEDNNTITVKTYEIIKE